MSTTENHTRRDRAKMYGSEMTARETLKHLSRTYPLRFKNRTVLDQPFTSATGTTRSKTALTFHDGQGGEILFTEGEVRTLIEFGVEVPPEAFKTAKKAPAKRGLGGLL